jgi:hypothetical protein
MKGLRGEGTRRQESGARGGEAAWRAGLLSFSPEPNGPRPPALPRNIWEGGAYSVGGGTSAADWCRAFDGWLPWSKEDWSVPGRSSANQRTLPIIKRQSLRLFETTPLPLKRLSLDNFPDCLHSRTKCCVPTLARAGQSAASQIGQRITPECTGRFCSVQFCSCTVICLLSF